MVITIIVLLILAGVTIATLTGENGILTRAETGKAKNEEANIEEQIKLAVVASKMNKNLRINTELLESELENNLGEDIEIEKQGENGELPWIITQSGYKFQITEDAEVKIKGMTLSKSDLKLNKGETEIIEVILAPGVSDNITWTSGDENVVTVNNGIVTAVDTGSTTVTAEIEGTEYSATCIIEVVMLQNSEQIATDIENTIGKTIVNYTAGDKEWIIFYADDKNVYLTTKNGLKLESLSEDGYNGISDLVNDLEKDFSQRDFPAAEKWLSSIMTEVENNDFSSSVSSMLTTEYLLDKNVWSDYADSEYADYAIGGPTLELLSASLEAVGFEKIPYSILNYGYKIDVLELPEEHVWYNGYNYWISAPHYNTSSYMWVAYGQYVKLGSFGNWGNMNFRPIVCLNENVFFEELESGGYKLVRN